MRLKSQSKRRVRIVNPIPHGAWELGYDRAERYVRNGRAEWVQPQTSIRFNQSHPKHEAAMEHSRRTAQGYDGVYGVMRRDEIRNIPVLFPERLR